MMSRGVYGREIRSLAKARSKFAAVTTSSGRIVILGGKLMVHTHTHIYIYIYIRMGHEQTK